MITHPIDPVYDENSKALILGSFPSVKSREQGFFYGHPQNRFWKVIADITDNPIPETIEEKKALLLREGIAVWDVIASCEITGSSDASIRNAVPNDLSQILAAAEIRAVFTNGGTAFRLYQKHLKAAAGMDAVQLASTSPANAAWSLQKLIAAWGKEFKKVFDMEAGTE